MQQCNMEHCNDAEMEQSSSHDDHGVRAPETRRTIGPELFPLTPARSRLRPIPNQAPAPVGRVLGNHAIGRARAHSCDASSGADGPSSPSAVADAPTACVRVHACASMRASPCVRVRLCLRMCVCVRASLRGRVHVRVPACAYASERTCVCVRARACACVRAHVRARTVAMA
jgi:hypothetical protein